MMGATIDRKALAVFVEILDSSPASLISFERAVELMTAIGFSCRLACQHEDWRQGISFFGPPGMLAPVEVEVETPVGRQHITLEQSMSLPATIGNALGELRHIREALQQTDNEGVDEERRRHLIEKAREMERGLIENTGPFQRSGLFKWPMDRFQLQISYGERSELVTICGPLMALLSHSSLADDTVPGVNVRDVARATVKLLMDREIERGRSIGSGFRAREEGAKLAELLREYIAVQVSVD